MRDSDIAGEYGQAWKVPLERAQRWVRDHPELVHQSARDSLFSEVWRDYWLVRCFVQDDLTARSYWRAVILRDLRASPPEIIRIYNEAEWDLCCVECSPPNRTPPVNGDGLFEWNPADGDAMLFAYQFHGLTDRQVLKLGQPDRPITFAQYFVEALVAGKVDEDITHRLSRIVNAIREGGFGDPPRPALEIADRTGLLVTTDRGTLVSLPQEVIPER